MLGEELTSKLMEWCWAEEVLELMAASCSAFSRFRDAIVRCSQHAFCPVSSSIPSLTAVRGGQARGVDPKGDEGVQP